MTPRELAYALGLLRSRPAATQRAELAALMLIEKPVAGSVAVSVAGSAVPVADYTVDAATGIVTFKPGKLPVSGAIRAGFEFDVPVRFDTDRIDIDLAQFNAGRIPSIPLVEIKP